MSLFVLSCKDGWVSIMYDGLDAMGVDQQVRRGSLAHSGGGERVCEGLKSENQGDERLIQRVNISL